MVKTPRFFPDEVKAIYKRAEDHESFWEAAALDAREDIHWSKKWDKVLDWEYPSFKWYVGGKTNICYSCLDYKVDKGLGDKKAFIGESGESGEKRASHITAWSSVSMSVPSRSNKTTSISLAHIGTDRLVCIALYPVPLRKPMTGL